MGGYPRGGVSTAGICEGGGCLKKYPLPKQNSDHVFADGTCGGLGGWGYGGVGKAENSNGVEIPETRSNALAKLIGQRGSADFLLLAGQLNNRGRSPNDLTSIAFGMFYGMSKRKTA